MQLTQRNTLWSQLEQMYFMTELKNLKQNRCVRQFLYRQCALISA